MKWAFTSSPNGLEMSRPASSRILLDERRPQLAGSAPSSCWAESMSVREPGSWVVTPLLDLRPGAESGRDVDVASLRRKDLTLNPERLGIGHCSADFAILIPARANHPTLASRSCEGIGVQRNRDETLKLGDLSQGGRTRRGHQEEPINGVGMGPGGVMKPGNGAKGMADDDLLSRHQGYLTV
jgi:hypothetical protein